MYAEYVCMRRALVELWSRYRLVEFGQVTESDRSVDMCEL